MLRTYSRSVTEATVSAIKIRRITRVDQQYNLFSAVVWHKP